MTAIWYILAILSADPLASVLQAASGHFFPARLVVIVALVLVNELRKMIQALQAAMRPLAGAASVPTDDFADRLKATKAAVAQALRDGKNGTAGASQPAAAPADAQQMEFDSGDEAAPQAQLAETTQREADAERRAADAAARLADAEKCLVAEREAREAAEAREASERRRREAADARAARERDERLAAESRANAAEARAEKERARADAAEARATDERSRADAAEESAAKARTRADAAEARAPSARPEFLDHRSRGWRSAGGPTEFGSWRRADAAPSCSNSLLARLSTGALAAAPRRAVQRPAPRRSRSREATPPPPPQAGLAELGGKRKPPESAQPPTPEEGQPPGTVAFAFEGPDGGGPRMPFIGEDPRRRAMKKSCAPGGEGQS